jgi:predicted nucleic acid-binding protein
MDLVVDANVLFAALIKRGLSAKLLFIDELHLYAPEYLMEEFNKYRREILKKTHRSSSEFDRVLIEISDRIHFVPQAEIEPFMLVGESTSPDADDAVYFALALKLGISIWSNDTRLKKQNVIRIYTTTELVHLYSSDVE